MERGEYDGLRAVLLDVEEAVEALNDLALVAADRLVRDCGLEADLPELALADEEREEIDARALGRTLSEIRRLPEAS